MPSNIFISNFQKKENIFLTKNTNNNVYMLVCSQNTNKQLQINLQQNTKINIYLLILANNNKNYFNLLINHFANNSVSNIFVNVLANNNSQVKIFCKSFAKQKSKNNKINQVINGLILDENSCIETIPSLDIDTNKLLAKHSANIGQINPEILFYLSTKGLTKAQSLQLMFNNFIQNINKNLNNKKINVQKEIKKILKE